MLNVELNVDLTARYSGRIFSNAVLNVEPRARCLTFMVLNRELNIDPTARYSRLVFSNAKTNVDPIARNSKIDWF